MPVDASPYNNVADPGNVVDIAKGYGQLQQQRLAIDQARVNLVNGQMNTMRSTLGALIANPNVGTKDVIEATGKLTANGVITSQQAAIELGNMPKDPAQIRGWLQNHLATVAANHDQFGVVTGTPAVQDNGQQQRSVNVNPLMGTVSPMSGSASVVQNRLSPSDAAQPVPGPPDAMGAPTNIAKGQFAERTGMAPQGVYTAPRPITAPQAPMAPQGQMRQPMAAPVVHPGNAMNAPGMPTGQAPGVGQAQIDTAQQSAVMGGELQKAAEGAPVRKGQLVNLEDDLKKFDSGPLAEILRAGKATFNQAGKIIGLPEGMQIDPAGVAAQENFNKQATQLAQQQFQALGGAGTDAKLDSAMHSNPNAALSSMGNRGILSLLKGNEDALAAKNTAWQKWKQANGPQTYGQFQEQFNKAYSPRAFQFVYMSPADRTDMLKSMNKNELDQIEKSINQAVTNGWIKAPANGQ